MIITQRINVTRDRSRNFIPVGQWDAGEVYKLSDMGIPVVEVPDNTSLGFSVYALDTEASTKGKKPSGSNSEWRLMESAEFIYMLQAYIKHLRATLITAEHIESLMIRTKNLEVKDGANIGNWSVNNGNLAAYYGYSDYIGGNMVFVNQDISLKTNGLFISASYGGTTEHPQVVSWGVEVTSSAVKVGDVEIKKDGIYIDGVKKL